MNDSRNVTDDLKGKAHEDIVKLLDNRGIELEIAIENTLRDFNMGTIVRSANAVGVRHLHVIGRRQWNKRGAMMTDKYLYIHYYQTIAEFIDEMTRKQKVLLAIDNTKDSQPLSQAELPLNAVMIFGQEGPGLSPELLAEASYVVAIEQLRS